MAEVIDPSDILEEEPVEREIISEDQIESDGDDTPTPKEPKDEQGFFSKVATGVLEPAATVASSIVAKPVSDVAGLSAMLYNIITGDHEGDPSAFKDYVQEELTYRPKTQGGKAGMQAVGTVLAPVGKAIDFGTDVVGDAGAGTADVLGVDDPAILDAIRSGSKEAGNQALNFVGVGNAAKGAQAATKAGARAAAPALEDMARGAAVAEVAGTANRSMLNSLTRRGKDMDAVSETGKYILDNDIVQWRDALPMADAETAQLARVTPLKQNAGQRMNNVYSNAADSATVDGGQLADALAEQFKDQITGKVPVEPSAMSAITQAISFLRSEGANAGKAFNAGELQQLKNYYKGAVEKARKSNQVSPDVEVKEQIWHALDDQIDNLISEADNKLANNGVPGTEGASLVDELDSAKFEYGKAANVEKGLQAKNVSEQAKKSAGFQDNLAAIGGVAAGGLGGGAITLAAKKGLLDKRNLLLAKGGRAASEALEEFGNAPGMSNNAVTATNIGTAQTTNVVEDDPRKSYDHRRQAIINALQTNPQSLGKYARTLQEAAERGDDSLAATMYVLGTSDSEFQKLFE